MTGAAEPPPDDLEPRVRAVLDRIRAAAKDAGLSQEALGRAIGVSKATVNSILQGGTHLRIETLFALADALGVSAEVLLGLRPDQVEADVIAALRELDQRGREDVRAIVIMLAAAARGDAAWLRAAARLPKRDQALVQALIDALPPQPPNGKG